MSATIDRPAVDARPKDGPAVAGGLAAPTRLLTGTELLGPMAGSGLREPPYLMRRRDGQIVQLSRLLYEIARRMDGRDLATIAQDAGACLELRITPEQVAYVAEHKLAPLGVVAPADGSEPQLHSINGMLALKFRAGIFPGRVVNALTRGLQPLFLPPVVIAALAALVACDVWLGTSHGIGAGVKTMIEHPALGLALFILTILSLVFHEWGHAGACRYGGARPGRIGIGIYLVWPVFFTDVTDSYRLSRAGRLRTDFGGVYFNVLFALSAAGSYFATGYEPLLIVVVGQQFLLLDQFIPWVRLDGYHIVSDLIGVSNLFARIKPVIASLRPGRQPDRRVTELKSWARAAVTIWVLTTVAALTTMAVAIILYAPGYLGRAWQSLILQLHGIQLGVRIGSIMDVLDGAIGAVMLILPVAGITLTYLLLCRQLGTSLAQRRTRHDLTLAAARPVSSSARVTFLSKNVTL
jgi:putative peptide zinc metalloprotease protein